MDVTANAAILDEPLERLVSRWPESRENAALGSPVRASPLAEGVVGRFRPRLGAPCADGRQRRESHRNRADCAFGGRRRASSAT